MTVHEMRIIYPGYAAKEAELENRKNNLDPKDEHAEDEENDPAASGQLGPDLTPDTTGSVSDG